MEDVKQQIKDNELGIDISYKPIEEVSEEEVTEEVYENGWSCSNCCCCCCRNDTTEYDMSDMKINNKDFSS